MPRSTGKIDTHIGNRIRMRRIEQGISQMTLAAAVGVSFQQIQKYEKGANRVSPGALQTIAGKLEVPIPYFYENAPGADRRKHGDPVEMTAFMTSPYGMAIAQAFMKLPDDSTLRGNVRDIIVSIAESYSEVAKAARPPRRAA